MIQIYNLKEKITLKTIDERIILLKNLLYKEKTIDQTTPDRCGMIWSGPIWCYFGLVWFESFHTEISSLI